LEAVCRGEFLSMPTAPVSLTQLRDYAYCPLLFYWKHVLELRRESQPLSTLELPGLSMRQALRVYFHEAEEKFESAVLAVWRTWLARHDLDQQDVLKGLLGYAQALMQILQGFDSGSIRKSNGSRYKQPRMSPKFKGMARSSGLPALADSLDEKLIPALGLVRGEKHLVGPFSVADAFTESLRMAQYLARPGALPPLPAVLGVDVPVRIRVGGWDLPAVADMLVMEDMGCDPPAVQVEVHEYDPFMKPHESWVSRDLRMIAALRMQPRIDTEISFGQVTGVTFRHMPSGWSHRRSHIPGGRLTHVLDTALRGIMEGVYLPMFLHDLHRCQPCAMRERCLNPGGLDALEVMAPALMSRVGAVSAAVQMVMPGLNITQRQILASTLKQLTQTLLEGQGSAFDLPATLNVLEQRLEPVTMVGEAA